jgi:hypothetical protein
MWNKSLLLVICLLVSTDIYSQSISADTLVDDKLYSKYVKISEDIVAAIKDDTYEKIIDEYSKQPIGLYDRRELKEYFSWLYEEIFKSNQTTLKKPGLIRMKYRFSYPSEESDELTKLVIVYDLGNNGCSDPLYINKFEIVFSNLFREHHLYDFNFSICRDAEAIKKGILAIPVPAKN